MEPFDPDMSTEEMAARMVVSDTDRLARRVSDMSGRSFGLTSLTPDRELWAWNHRDDTQDEDYLRSIGMPQSEINAHVYPLRPQLMSQAGRSFEEQRAYHDRMEERRLRAEAAGRTPKPPQRQGGLHAPTFKPFKEG
jgi:hypothetical protein